MNASKILADEENMTLEEKLDAIDRAMQAAQEVENERRASAGLQPVILDPADLTICDGCT